ncbi:MAG: hypothetical protein ACREV1_00425 [Gammaproteobacteria bacterium]
MKLLQALRASAKIKNVAAVICADGVSCRFLRQTYRTDLQRLGLLKIALWLANEQVSATRAAEEMVDVPETKKERRNRSNPQSNQ